ncbi:MAG: hypothetical protein IIC57_03785 [Proteobacteria bacterium]|nr:hypothetical protein [Pseudomonadota bacterium]
MNLASRIEELCMPGKVTVDEATQLDTLRFIDYERKTNLQTSRGRSSPSHNQLVSLLK